MGRGGGGGEETEDNRELHVSKTGHPGISNHSSTYNV